MANYIDDLKLTQLLIKEKQILYSDILIDEVVHKLEDVSDINNIKIKYDNNVLNKKYITKFNKKYIRVSIPVNILTNDEIKNRKTVLNIFNNKKLILQKCNLKYIASNELGKYFLEIEENILKKSNWRNYSQAYKDELMSSANTFFARYWWKFDPIRMRLNYTLEKGKKILKEKIEYKGAFLYFTSLAYSGNLAGIKFLNKSKQSKEISDNKNTKRDIDILCELYNGRDQPIYV